MDIVKKIANYTYNERHCLGQGSFGRVYEGRSDEGLKVAIKKVEQSLISKDPYLRSSLQTEINIMKKLNHPNIIRLYDVVTTANSIYLIMEYCAGGDLKRYCRNKRLSQEEATAIIKNIVKGFQQIVQQGIIHRDLKPANILVHQGVFKICDFGFAKFFNDASRMTRTCVGTPIYMSPQVLAQKTYTDKADVWSLGVLYYELLFGKLPYYGVTEDALYKNIIKGPLAIPNCNNFTTMLLRGMLEIQENKRLSWGKLFQLFGLVPPGGNTEQQQQVQNNIGFYKPIEIRKQPSDKNIDPEEYEPQLANNYREHVQRNGSYQNIELNDGKKVVPQRKPKNPLAFQNPIGQIPQNQNQPPVEKRQIQIQVQQLPQINPVPNPPIIKAKPSITQPQNPRFLYFILIQLITEPIKNSQSYPQLVSAIYRKAIELYVKKIEKQKDVNGLYGRVLLNEYEELKSFETEIPSFPNADMDRCAEAVLKQANGQCKAVMAWVERLVNRNYNYDR